MGWIGEIMCLLHTGHSSCAGDTTNKTDTLMELIILQTEALQGNRNCRRFVQRRMGLGRG